jgi:SAM-dependent methyltransferase
MIIDKLVESDYRKSHIYPGKGKEYHLSFSQNAYRKMIWDYEKNILDQIIEKYLASACIEHLDFACGTGRIARFLEERVRSVVGVDISASMLQVARINCIKAEIIEADITKDDLLADRKFNFITAFRFFANAQPDLRKQVMTVLRRHLTDGGYFVFNNHKNTGSTRNRIARAFGHREFKGMSIYEVQRLICECKLEIVDAFHLCTFPSSDELPILPLPILCRIEKGLSRLPFLWQFGENIIFVCQRTNKTIEN